MQYKSLAKTPKSENRNSAIELLRIVSIIMIIGCHFATHGGFEFDSQSITVPRLWWNILEMGGNFGTAVFVLISGYFMIENKTSIKWKKVLKFWGQIIFYSILLFFSAFAIGKGSFNPVTVIKAMFPITFSEWWFASTYFVMFLLHPYINKFLHSLAKNEYQTFLIFLFILWSVIPTITTSKYQSNALLEFIMFYSIAGYIKLYGLNKKLKSKHYFALWLLFTVITYLSCVIFILLGTKFPVFSDHSIYFYARNSVLTILRAVCFFMTFETITMSYYPFINKVASAAFGVYLLHDSNVLRPFLWKVVFKNASFQHSNWIILYSIGVVMLVFVVFTIFDLFRQWVFEKPYMNLVNKYIDKILYPFIYICDKAKSIIFGNNNK